MLLMAMVEISKIFCPERVELIHMSNLIKQRKKLIKKGRVLCESCKIEDRQKTRTQTNGKSR